MCGIAGVVRFTAADAADDARLGAVLREALAHRGPDGGGEYRSPDRRALLVHRRLAIIDPHDRSSQPMSTPDGRFHLTYNGEIYNHRDLRARIEARGVALRTLSDTEVLLHLLGHDGPAALAEARGMFALALWDARERTLLVARDRYGMKPLYVAATPGRVAFASEIQALRRTGLAGGNVSAAGVLAYLNWGSIPAPLTWVADVEHLEPGTWMRWSADGRCEAGRFADARAAYVEASGVTSVDEALLRERASAAVRDSLRAHLVADVPVGIFLSGGVDSGAIVSAARSVTDAPLHTCTVAVAGDASSEEAPARAVAERFGTEHRVLFVDATQIAGDLDTIIDALDQPTGDAVNSFYVSRAVASTGIKAVLSGVGGDEMFGGYPSFARIPPMAGIARACAPVVRASRAAAGLALPAWQAEKWRHFAAEPELTSAYRALRGLFMPHEIATIAGPALRDAAVWGSAHTALSAAERQIEEPAGEESSSAAVARMETHGFLRNQLLRDVDAISMAHGLEVRLPFVDHALQAAVWPALGRHPRLLEGKRLLHETLAHPLPAAVTTRPKQGFTLPFDRWMRGPLRAATRDGIHALAAAGWLARNAADETWNAFERRQAHWSRPWALGVLGRFLERAR